MANVLLSPTDLWQLICPVITEPESTKNTFLKRI